MRDRNYCHEECVQNGLSVDIHGKLNGRNAKLKCKLGYKQTVNSVKARVNSEMAGSIICPRLKRRFPIQAEEEKI